MLFSKRPRVSTKRFFMISFAAFLLASSALPFAAEHPATTLNTLPDRAQIEDLLVDYYGQLGSGGRDFSTFYVEDRVLDVNSTIAKGRKPIEDLYKSAGSPARQGTFHMFLTNLKIVFNGATATADVLRSGINSETVKSAPQLIEQDREHDDLVKRNGQWLFKHRVITSDG